jgi:hypothetical protein
VAFDDSFATLDGQHRSMAEIKPAPNVSSAQWVGGADVLAIDGYACAHRSR